MKILSQILSFVCLCSAVSCATVQQIDRGRLSKRMMQLEPMPHEEAFITETHNIREGAAGGVGQNSGGGCGCN